VGLFQYGGHSLKPERSFYVGEPVRSAAFSPDGGLLVLGKLNGDIEWLAPQTGRYFATFEGHLFGINDLAFSNTGLYMVSGGDDSRVLAWNPTQFNDPTSNKVSPIKTWRTVDRVTCVDISQNLQIVVGGSYQTWYAWDLNSGDTLFEANGLDGWINDISISPSEQNLAVADSSNRIRLWDMLNWHLTHDVTLDQVGQITALDFSPDGVSVAIGTKNGDVFLWDLSANVLTVLGYPLSSGVTDLSFRPGGDALLVGYERGNLRYLSRQ
jgi:WD40 repeat protein